LTSALTCIRFSLAWDALLQIDSKSNTTLPTEHPISAFDLFSAYLELSQPATKRSISMLIEASKEPQTKQTLQNLLETDFDAQITQRRVSLLTLLERHPTIDLPLSAFVASQMSMRVRQYSISSSPLADPRRATLTYAVLDAEALSGHGRHVGVASWYLSHLNPGDIVHVAVKASHQAFHLPVDSGVPVLMFCAGTGLAPFRSFVQERASADWGGEEIGAGASLLWLSASGSGLVVCGRVGKMGEDGGGDAALCLQSGSGAESRLQAYRRGYAGGRAAVARFVGRGR